MCLAIPGRITEIYEVAGLQMGKVDFGGITKEACLSYLDNPQVGEYTMIHVGFAISKVDEEEAFRTLELLRAMGELDEELGVDLTVDLRVDFTKDVAGVSADETASEAPHLPAQPQTVSSIAKTLPKEKRS